MPIDIRIIDADIGPGEAAHVHNPKEGPPGLAVYTEERRDGNNNVIKFLQNDCYGINLNQNVTFGGSPDFIHGGGDCPCVDWTASAISGTWDFASCAQANGGTGSIDGTATVNNDEALFTSPCPVDISGYTALTGAVFITAWSTSGTKELELRLRLAGACVGCVVPLSNYINEGEFCTWQTFVIPKADLGVCAQCIDELVVRNVDIGAGQAIDFYLDCLQLEQTGSPAIFSLPLENGKMYQVDRFTIFMADNIPATVTNGTTLGLAYNKLMGLCALANGITIVNKSNGFTSFSGRVSQLGDLIQLAPVSISASGSDGTNTWIKIDVTFTKPYKYFAKKDDSLTFTVNDNLSGLLAFRVSAVGQEYPLVEEEE
jgi:hypothetical protein